MPQTFAVAPPGPCWGTDLQSLDRNLFYGQALYSSESMQIVVIYILVKWMAMIYLSSKVV